MKKLFSLVAALMMCCAMWAADEVDTLYLNTGGSTLWNSAGAKFSVWYWNDNEQGHFSDFLELAYGETDIYRAIIPHKDSVIFVRHDAAADVPTWENKWNQTNADEVDLEIGNIMVITGWQPADREWDYYTPKEPCVDNYGLMIDGTYVPGVYNETSSEWTVLKQDLTAGQKLMMYSYCGETSFAPKQGNYADFFDVDGDTLIVKEDAEYDFYIQLISGNDKLWVVQRKTVTLPRITKAPKSWAGEYAITAMANDTAIVWTGVDAGQCRDSIKLVNGNLVAQDPVMVVVEAMKDGGYSVKVKGGANDGKYISSFKNSTYPAYNNSLGFTTTPYRVDITMNGSLVDFFQTINTQKVYLLYNKTKGSSGERFRFYKETNYGGSSYMSLALFGTPAPSYDYDTVMYVAGNFTNWAADMKVLPDTVTMPEDSVLAFKQVRVITTKLGETVIKTDTAWFGQKNEGAYMTRENSKDGWTLDGEYNVLLRTDAAGDYTFSLNGESFKVTFPALDEKVYFKGFSYQWADTAMQITDDTIATLTLHHDAVMVDSFVIHKGDTYWKIDASAIDMHRDNCTNWGVTTATENVKDITIQIDKAGDYTYVLDMKNNKLSVTYPEAVIEYDTAMYVAGDFTNWETGMQKLPHTANLPKDSTIEFKQVRQVIKYFDAIPVDTTLTWYGTPGTEPMTRENSTWLLNGENNVTLTTDVAGDYKFEIIAATGEMKVTWPDQPATMLDVVMMNEQVNKVLVNGQFYIIRNNVLYNATGARVK